MRAIIRKWNSSKGSNIFLVDESKNPTGTYKDRRSAFIIAKAKEFKVDKLCLITSGNAGYSLAKAGAKNGLKIFCIVDKKLKSQTKAKLRKNCDRLIEYDLSRKILKPEEVIALARESDNEVIWDATNGFPEAYESIISDLGNRKFDYIICPVGSGEAFFGLFTALQKRKLKTKLIGVGVHSYPSFADKLATPWTPYKSKINSIIKNGHRLLKLSEPEVRAVYKEYKNRLRCEPSSAVVWAAFNKIKFKSTDRILLINSGRGI